MPDQRPNVLIIWGDDIGQSNLSCYSNGLMGYRTPNIDRIAAEGRAVHRLLRGAELHGWAGRVHHRPEPVPHRSDQGGPARAPLGLQAQDPTIATALKAQGYATGQFGKNHLGDRDEHLPTMHGFDEFFGNLYHLNAEEEPELPDYPKDPEFRKEVRAPRRAAHLGQRRRHPAHRGHRPAHQEADGNLSTTKSSSSGSRLHQAPAKAETPFFVWFNTTHMHFRTHTKPESVGRAGRWQSRYHDTMLDHDDTVGSMLDLLDELGIAESTIVMYSHRQRSAHEQSGPTPA